MSYSLISKLESRIAEFGQLDPGTTLELKLRYNWKRERKCIYIPQKLADPIVATGRIDWKRKLTSTSFMNLFICEKKRSDFQILYSFVPHCIQD